MSSSDDEDRCQTCEQCSEDKGLCDQPGPRDGKFFTMKLYEDFDIFTFIPCHARRYFLERLGFEEHDGFETRRANLRTKHGHTFLVKVMNAVNNTELGCSNWEALCKAYGFQEDMEITFDLHPEDHIEGNIDIWVDVDMLPVLPPAYFVSSSETQNIIGTTHYTYGSHLTWEEKDDLIYFVIGVLVGRKIVPYNLETGPDCTLYRTLVHRLRTDDIRRNILIKVAN